MLYFPSFSQEMFATTVFKSFSLFLSVSLCSNDSFVGSEKEKKTMKEDSNICRTQNSFRIEYTLFCLTDCY